MRDLHTRCKVTDIVEGNKILKKVIEAKLDLFSVLNRIEGKDNSYNHDIVLSTNKLFMIESQLK